MDLNQQPSYLSIIIPAYNESDNIFRAVDTNAETGRELAALSFEIIVVNDSSTDDTGKILSELKANYPELRIITHETNLGIGGAIRSGIRAVRGRFCVSSPADSPYKVETLSPFLAIGR